MVFFFLVRSLVGFCFPCLSVLFNYLLVGSAHTSDLAPSKGEAGEIGRENRQWYNSRFTWDKEKYCLLNYLRWK